MKHYVYKDNIIDLPWGFYERIPIYLTLYDESGNKVENLTKYDTCSYDFDTDKEPIFKEEGNYLIAEIPLEPNERGMERYKFTINYGNLSGYYFYRNGKRYTAYYPKSRFEYDANHLANVFEDLWGEKITSRYRDDEFLEQVKYYKDWYRVIPASEAIKIIIKEKEENKKDSIICNKVDVWNHYMNLSRRNTKEGFGDNYKTIEFMRNYIQEHTSNETTK